MAYAKEEVISLIKRFTKEIAEIVHTDRVFLFGSYAKDNPDEYSDIDIAIISQDIDDGNYFELKKKIFKKAIEVNSYIEPLCFSKEEFDNDWLPIIPEIKRRGIEIKV